MHKHLSYYENRAEAELRRARAAIHPAAIFAHYRLADLYLERVDGAERSVERIAAASPVTNGGMSN